MGMSVGIDSGQAECAFISRAAILFSWKEVEPFCLRSVWVYAISGQAIISGQRLSASDSGFSSALGGGFGHKVGACRHPRIQIDYFRPNFFGEAHNRGGAFGVVLHVKSRLLFLFSNGISQFRPLARNALAA